MCIRDRGKMKGWTYVYREEELDGLSNVDVVLLSGYHKKISADRMDMLRMDIESGRLRDKTDEYISSLKR